MEIEESQSAVLSESEDENEEEEECDVKPFVSLSNKLMALAFLLLITAVSLPNIMHSSNSSTGSYDYQKQERPPLSPSVNFNNLAMQERGRMGAHPASNSGFQMETVKSRQPGPGASRMPPIPMKMNMNSKTGGQSVPVQATQPKLGGSLAVIVPVYGIGIVGFFAFTLYKIFFKKKNDEEEEDSEEKDAVDCAANVKWDDMTTRISNIGKMVDKVVKNEPSQKEDAPEGSLNNNEHDDYPKVEPKCTVFENVILDQEPTNNNKGTYSTKGESTTLPDPRDLEISMLKIRLEETEKAMERIVAHMGIITSKLAPHVIAQALEGVSFDKAEPERFASEE